MYDVSTVDSPNIGTHVNTVMDLHIKDTSYRMYEVSTVGIVKQELMRTGSQIQRHIYNA